jgi:hypothetical protein
MSNAVTARRQALFRCASPAAAIHSTARVGNPNKARLGQARVNDFHAQRICPYES